MSIFRQILRSSLSLTLPRSRFFTRGPKRNNALYLTFDDGPHPQHTPRLLDMLAAHDARATFFVIGENAQRHPEIVRRIVREGHTIGNHTFSHTRAEKTSAEALIRDARHCGAALAEILGHAPALLRPPYGHLNIGKLTALLRARYTVALWNRDAKDYAAKDAAALHHALAQLTPRSGDVFLFHDTYPHAAAALPSFISAYKKSFTFAALPAAIKLETSFAGQPAAAGKA